MPDELKDRMDQVVLASGAKFDYSIKIDKVEIYYKAIDVANQMKIIRGLVYNAFNHIKVSAGYIEVYLDDKDSLEICW
jgi:hypothetical protein